MSGVEMKARVRVEYFDQNESFARLLPRSGTIVNRCTDVHGNRDWWMVELDEPVEYQLKVGELYQYKLVNIGHFLIRSRVVGKRVGSKEPVSVFILAVENGPTVPEPFDPKSYPHVAWGTSVTEA